MTIDYSVVTATTKRLPLAAAMFPEILLAAAAMNKYVGLSPVMPPCDAAAISLMSRVQPARAAVRAFCVGTGHDGAGDLYKSDVWWQQRWRDEQARLKAEAEKQQQDAQQ
jgi:hypothetical protein